MPKNKIKLLLTLLISGCILCVVAEDDPVVFLLETGETLYRFFTPKTDEEKVFVVDESVPPVLINDQVYSYPHESSLEEWETRKELYSELIDLRSANRQPDYLTFYMENYAQIAKRNWDDAEEEKNGIVSCIFVGEELVPIEYQVSPKQMKRYLDAMHLAYANFCDYVRTLPRYSQLICIYFAVSTEAEVLQKPILDLSPETLYSTKNLEGRMKRLRKIYPYLTKVGQQIIDLEKPQTSMVDRDMRGRVYSMLIELYRFSGKSIFTQKDFDHFNIVAAKCWNNAYKHYDGKVEVMPTYLPEFMPRKYIDSETEQEAYIKSRENYYQNYCDYINTLPPQDALICKYIQSITMLKELEKPIIDLKTDNSYPYENLILRWEKLRDLLPQIRKMEKQIRTQERINNYKMEN